MEIDIDRFSRQLAAYGFESMRNLASMTVLSIGLGGLGLETVKNLILSGPKKVVVYDNSPIVFEDLSACFCFSEENIGQKKSLVAVKYLKELHPFANVSAYDGELDENYIQLFTLVFASGIKLSEKIRINELCRKSTPQIGFIFSENYGVTGVGFVDFGDNFICNDPYENRQSLIQISSVSKESEAIVTCLSQHFLETGDCVTFKNVQGMTELNSFESVKVTVVNDFSFSIIDTSNFNIYETGGTVQKIVKPLNLKFDSLKDSLNNPRISYIYPDPTKPNRNIQIHLAFRAVAEFEELNDRLPELLNEQDSESCFNIAQQMNLKNSGEFYVDTVDKELVSKTAKYSKSQISPFASIWGGIMSQEILKHTGKYRPAQQWIYLDFLDIIGPDPIIYESRDKSQALILGEKANKILNSKEVFLIGAGATGCELLKQIVLMGVKKIIITDDDQIEISNLSRQFLYRQNDRGKNKSITAGSAAKKFNKNVEIISKTSRVSKDNLKEFDEIFWNTIDFTILAVDNFSARIFIDDLCVQHEKPIFECGTSGIRGSSTVVLPHQTISYNDIPQQVKEAPAACTLKSFPYTIGHCAQWSRNEFEFILNSSVSELNNFAKDIEEYKNTIVSLDYYSAIEKLDCLSMGIELALCKNEQDIVNFVASRFEELFFYRIEDIIRNFPPDYTTSKGAKFWVSPKRIPTAMPIDFNNQLCLDFIKSGYKLIAEILGMEKIIDITKMLNYYSGIRANSHSLIITEDEEINNNAMGDVSIYIEHVIARGQNVDKGKMIKTIDFDKDCNDHIDFVVACTNCRARNYFIAEGTWFDIKIIAGNIAPAISTTTSVITGLLGIEICRIGLSDNYENYRNSMINLIEPLIKFSIPMDTLHYYDDEKFYYRPEGFSKWSKLRYKSPLTLKVLEEDFRLNFFAELQYLVVDDYCLFLKEIIEDDKQMLIEELFMKNYNFLNIDRAMVILVSALDIETKKIVKTPPILYSLE
ncbi:hypothetical protein SteCoe_37567 [Stentor coeruleus]|uniref:Ubiquitin-activating enzyme E1 C-terminal domain-containing protein n=1 Tax=Stentor coeruleus TaxID=5963 RepID=A0A1R2AN13_9CILI|nr:hypothetical protein SteCoe_37567 [Stentor coeruleus]